VMFVGVKDQRQAPVTLVDFCVSCGFGNIQYSADMNGTMIRHDQQMGRTRSLKPKSVLGETRHVQRRTFRRTSMASVFTVDSAS
jgi:hypothetical protein